MGDGRLCCRAWRIARRRGTAEAEPAIAHRQITLFRKPNGLRNGCPVADPLTDRRHFGQSAARSAAPRTRGAPPKEAQRCRRPGCSASVTADRISAQQELAFRRPRCLAKEGGRIDYEPKSCRWWLLVVSDWSSETAAYELLREVADEADVVDLHVAIMVIGTPSVAC